MAKKDIKHCKYSHCLHKDKALDITQDDYMQKGRSYYHADCYRTLANIELIKSIWVQHISDTVVYSYLVKTLNQLIFDNNISSDYILFVIQYCINNNKNLRYPGGIKYFVDDKDIRDAYIKKYHKAPRVKMSEFKAESQSDEPKFTISMKQSGFGSIIRR